MNMLSDIQADARAASSTGLEPPFAAALAYLAGPFSGILLLLAERSNRFVQFHAWQAIFGLGSLAVFGVGVLVCAFLGLFISPRVFTTLYMCAGVLALVWLAVWVFCLFKAFSGSAWKMPLFGGLAERRVTSSRAP
jgi:uncharacterized membrane protein